MDEKGNVFSKRFIPKKGGYIFEELLSTNPMSVPTLLIRKECFKKVGLFDSALDGQEDWDMWIRIAKYYQFSLIKIPLAKRRIHPNRMSYRLDKKVITAQTIIRKHIDELKIRKNIHSKHYFYIGLRCCRIGKTEIARKYISKAISLYPFYFYYYILFILSYLGSKGFVVLVKLIRLLKNRIVKLMNRKTK
jgi:tetratricopeptide (TPR) repeat protein